MIGEQAIPIGLNLTQKLNSKWIICVCQTHNYLPDIRHKSNFKEPLSLIKTDIKHST